MPRTVLSVEDKIVTKTDKVFSFRSLHSGRNMVGIAEVRSPTNQIYIDDDS